MRRKDGERRVGHPGALLQSTPQKAVRLANGGPGGRARPVAMIEQQKRKAPGGPVPGPVPGPAPGPGAGSAPGAAPGPTPGPDLPLVPSAAKRPRHDPPAAGGGGGGGGQPSTGALLQSVGPVRGAGTERTFSLCPLLRLPLTFLPVSSRRALHAAPRCRRPSCCCRGMRERCTAASSTPAATPWRLPALIG